MNPVVMDGVFIFVMVDPRSIENQKKASSAI
jgi:hypothetical protein